jgi:hypothetical protein
MRGKKKKKTIPLTVLLAYSVKFTLPVLSILIYLTCSVNSPYLFCQFTTPLLSICHTYSLNLITLHVLWIHLTSFSQIYFTYSVILPLPVLSVHLTSFSHFTLPILSISLTYSVKLPYLFCLNLPHLVCSFYLPIIY